MAAGNGWAVCGYHTFLKKYINVPISHHSGDIPLGFYPVIVVDMWEHAYARDYLTDKKSYLIAQMREINWEVCEDRLIGAFVRLPAACPPKSVDEGGS
jgi:Fe-Mn family superoxide dismutase